MPQNYCWLGALTAFETVLVSSVTASYAFEDVLISLGVLSVVVGSEFIVSLFIPKDPNTL